MFEHYFLDKHDEVAFKLFRMLKALGDQSFTVNKLSVGLKLSYQKTLKTYHELEANLRTIQLANHRPDLAQSESFQNLCLGIHVDTYRFFLLQHAICFQFYNQLLQDGQINFEHFAATHGVSTSTLRRRVEPFRKFLYTRKLAFDMNQWVLQGSELSIRQLMTTFFNEAYRGGSWPFTELSKETVAECDTTLQTMPSMFQNKNTQVLTLRRMIALGVQLLRINQGHYFVPNSQMDKMLPDGKYLKDLVFTREFFPNLPPRALAAERYYYYFMRISKLDLSRQASPLQRNITNYFTSFDNPVRNFADTLLVALTQTLDPFHTMRIRTDAVLRTNLYRVAYSYFVINGTFIKASDFSDREEYDATGDDLLKAITTFIQNLPNASPARVFKRFLPDIAHSIFFVLLPDYEDFEPQALLQVRVELEIQGIITRDMLDFLQGLGILSILPDNSPAPADVIITSSPNLTNMVATMNGHFTAQTDATGPTIMYWGSENTDADLYTLVRKLRNMANAKIQERESTLKM